MPHPGLAEAITIILGGLGSSLPSSLTVAGSTPAVSVREHGGIRRIERMAMDAASLASIDSRGSSLAVLCVHVSQVVGLSAEEEMIRPHARRVVAAVENRKIIGDRTIGQFPGIAVRQNRMRRPPPQIKSAITG